MLIIIFSLNSNGVYRANVQFFVRSFNLMEQVNLALARFISNFKRQYLMKKIVSSVQY